jgi:hypothetical protein
MNTMSVGTLCTGGTSDADEEINGAFLLMPFPLSFPSATGNECKPREISLIQGKLTSAKANPCENENRRMENAFRCMCLKVSFPRLRTLQKIQKQKTGFVLLGTMRLKSQPCKSRVHRRPTNMKHSASTMAKPSSFVDSGCVQI